MFRALIAAVLALVAGLAEAATPVASVPYRIDYGGWIILPFKIYGKGPFDFIVDTGSTRTLIFANVMGPIGGVTPTRKPPVSVVGLASNEKFSTFRVGDLDIGGVVFPDHETVVLSDWTVEGRSPQGLLGLDLLERYYVEFDAKARVMRFYDGAAPPDAPGRPWKQAKISRETFTIEQGALYTTEVRLNSARMKFMVDTGAARLVVNRAGAGAGSNRGVVVRLKSMEGVYRLEDALAETVDAYPAKFQRLKIGDLTTYDVFMVVYNAPVMSELGVADGPFGLLGASFFEDRSFALDFARGRLWLGPKLKKPTS